MDTGDEQIVDGAQRNARGDIGFFQALLANAGDVMTLLDEQGIMIYHSDALIDMMGVTPDSAVGMPAVNVVHPDDRARVAEKIDRCRSHPDELITEVYRMMHANGSWRWVEANVKNLLSDQSVQGILVVSRDITDQQRLKHHYAIAEEAAGFFAFHWPIGQDIITLSANTKSMLGTSSTVGSEGMKQIVHPDDYEVTASAWFGAVKTKTPFEIHIRLRDKDGIYRHCIAHGYPELDIQGAVAGLMGVIVDATQSVEQEQALIRTTQQYQLIAENAHDIFARHGPDTLIKFISPAVKKLLGLDPSQCIGLNIADIMHPADVPRTIKSFKLLLDDGDNIRIVYRLRHVMGNYVWLESTVHAVRNADNREISEFIAITRDISEQKKHERQMLEAREKAESANRTKSAFLANMSHELRTPLNAIIGFSEILKRQMFGPLGDEKYEDYSGLILESGLHLLELINDVLDMSKIEAGKMEISPEPLNLADIASNCIRLVEARALSKHQTIVLDLENLKHGRQAFADLRATKQILLNLLTNAIKFTGENGSIIVSVTETPDELELSVADTGIGISQEDIPRLVRPFEQVTSASSLSHEGSGLGLALTKSFAELQNGTFEIESEQGVGTKVRVTLPLFVPSLRQDYAI